MSTFKRIWRHTDISVELEDGILLEGPARQVFCIRRARRGAVALFGLYFAHCKIYPRSQLTTTLYLKGDSGSVTVNVFIEIAEIRKFVDSRVLSYQHVSVLVCQALVLIRPHYARKS